MDQIILLITSLSLTASCSEIIHISNHKLKCKPESDLTPKCHIELGCANAAVQLCVISKRAKAPITVTRGFNLSLVKMPLSS